MFAYCNNNPVNGYDPSGHASWGTTTVAICDGGCNCTNNPFYWNDPSRPYYAEIAEAEVRIAAKFDTHDVQAAQDNLINYGFTYYKGTPVYSADWMGTSALSFGVIIIGSGNLSRNDLADTLNHEYGHVIHYEQIGPVDYFFTSAIPSLVGAGLTNLSILPPGKYYNQPWERTADYLGGVDRGYSQYANTAGSVFYAYTLVVSAITPY